MNSRNHHMFSSVGHYLVTRVAGLTRGPGAKDVTAMVGGEDSSSVVLRSNGGDVKFSWVRQDGVLSIDVAVPVSMQAYLHVPISDGLWHKKDHDEILSTQVVERHGSKWNLITVGSGHHSFVNAQAEIVV